MSRPKNEIAFSTVLAHVTSNSSMFYNIYIPKKIVAHLGLKKGDKVIWEMVEDNGRKYAIIRKLEL
jgi:bifunctional DNA-binding transcriptional regulator/antitoxin component of YhaV-PrlF toxin-antitoxin module